MAKHNDLGVKGEQLAVEFLKQKGYSIVAVNWREQKFEIDIIAKDHNQFVFIEVKTRTTDFFGHPAEAVTQAKQKHLINGAEYYLENNEIDLDSRFDIISIVMNKNQVHIEHLKDAFSSEA